MENPLLPLIEPDDRVIFVVGPTAVGKSALGFDVARRLQAEIVCCDAMQVYRQITIASDKPTPAQRLEIPHHCLDCVNVTEHFDVAAYRALATQAIEGIVARGKRVVVIGGSGMYMSILLDGICDTPRDDALRANILSRVESEGLPALHAQLTTLDPLSAARIHVNDAKRIVRALEVALSAGEPLSHLRTKRSGLWGKYAIKVIGVNRPRPNVYERINARVIQMFDQGLVDEIRAIAALPLSATASTLIGIPEVSGFLRAEYDKDRAIYLMQRNTRHFAKRQWTWFRRDTRVQWVDV